LQEKRMAIEFTQNVNSLSSQEQIKKENNTENPPIKDKHEEIKKEAATPPVLSETDLKKLIETLEKGIKQFNRKLKFDINKEINRIVVKVIDKNTEKVIREIPPSEIQNLLVKIREAIGLLYDMEI
jgi:flagellar protein FlaG